jgi:hypothetical protein
MQVRVLRKIQTVIRSARFRSYLSGLLMEPCQIDTTPQSNPPYVPPRVENGIVHGPGVCDDKGPLVQRDRRSSRPFRSYGRSGFEWNHNVVAMFVVEDETGGMVPSPGEGAL